MPPALSSRMRVSTDGFTLRRPSFVPFALARASPVTAQFPGRAATASVLYSQERNTETG
jgi:hypothetical protein